VTIGEIAAILRRHIAAVIAVIAAAAAVGYGMGHTPVTYQASGTLYSFLPPTPWQKKLTAQVGSSQGEAVLMAILSILLMSQRGQRQVRSAGAVASFDVAQVNLGSLQYPVYSEPEVTVTTWGTDPALVRKSFAIVTRVLNSDLAALQAQAGAPARYRLTVRFLNGTSLQAEPGSGPRMYSGLAVLAVVVIFAAVILLDRRRPRSSAARGPAAPGSVIAASQRG
jgi:hypothetical protein